MIHPLPAASAARPLGAAALPPLDPSEVEALGRDLARVPAEELVAWAGARFGERLALSTSFGIHSAVMLHLATRILPHIPVVWVDTGYLPPETYRFAEQLSHQLDLNLHVVQAELSPARMEALHGRLWESDEVADLDRYDRIRKVEPMQRALAALGSQAWLAGLRSEQTRHRAGLPRVGLQGERLKILPLLHWSTRELHAYLKRHDLPYHPLFEQGYATVGDAHSSRPVGADDADARATRFRGLKQECGLHLTPEQDRSLGSSGL